MRHGIVEQTGLPLPHLALDFIVAHPAATSVIIELHTRAQLTDLWEGVDT